MATKTQYYNLNKPSYDEVADIEIINANFDKIDQQMRNNEDGVNFAKGISSDAYDNSRSYAVGDYCIYDNKLYRCITAIESAEAFNIAKWEHTTVGKEVKQLSSNLDVIGKCKNLLNPILQTTTQNGITCTNNGDGTYTLNGTATKNADFSFIYNLEKYQHLKNRTVKLVGCPKGGSSTTYRLMLQLQKDPWSGAYDSGEGSIITINNDDNWQCWIRIYEGATVSNLTFKPMITTNLNATYDDFVPYTGDGETLTHDVSELKNDLNSVIRWESIPSGQYNWTVRNLPKSKPCIVFFKNGSGTIVTEILVTDESGNLVLGSSNTFTAGTYPIFVQS